jgi:hypothetical protein
MWGQPPSRPRLSGGPAVSSRKGVDQLWIAPGTQVKRKRVPHVSPPLRDIIERVRRLLHDQSRVFTDRRERLRAKEIAETKGALLCKPAPLGYSGSEALVVFSRNCPNNTLPILWEKNREWIPLFRRD